MRTAHGNKALYYLLKVSSHFQEVFCILHGVLYFLLVPAMYLFLTIYSIMNLHVVAWGTREKPPTVAEQAKKDGEQRLKKEEKAKNTMIRQSLDLVLNWRTVNSADNKDLEEINAKLDKVLSALYPPMVDTNESSKNPALQDDTKRDPQYPALDNKKYAEEGDVKEAKEYDKLPLWKSKKMLEWKKDPDVLSGPEDELAESEVYFWNDMLDVSKFKQH
ncbi:hypothetical protein BIW11_10775 [Tropilaelaps mercedesae]|uniref:Uncharacterized protein n=1 Tax=Tropilaelaps mercedesae TaxID=418985 RepID=A0A1V9XEF5_9ACAR|nr:hypothetical protein BIW11_10775 [Tropilaelaps mercedesae]